MSKDDGLAPKRSLRGKHVTNKSKRPHFEVSENENEVDVAKPGSSTTVKRTYPQDGKKEEIILKKVRGCKVSDIRITEHVNGPANCRNNGASGSIQLPENISVDRATEVIPNTAMLACKNYAAGCRATFEQAKSEHELSCEFRPCFCPDISCMWQGPMEEIIPHLMMFHSPICSLKGENVTSVTVDIEHSGSPCWVNILSCFGVNFLLVLKKIRRYGNPTFVALVQIIGTRKDAEKFIYSVELKKQKQTLSWEATACSVQEAVDILSNTACMSFDVTTARHFAHNGCLDIHTTIIKV